MEDSYAWARRRLRVDDWLWLRGEKGERDDIELLCKKDDDDDVQERVDIGG